MDAQPLSLVLAQLKGVGPANGSAPLHLFPSQVRSDEFLVQAKRYIAEYNGQSLIKHTLGRLLRIPPIPATARHYRYERPGDSAAVGVWATVLVSKVESSAVSQPFLEELYNASLLIRLVETFRPGNPITFNPYDPGEMIGHLLAFYGWVSDIVPIDIEAMDVMVDGDDPGWFLTSIPIDFMGFGYLTDTDGWGDESDDLRDDLDGPDKFMALVLLAGPEKAPGMIGPYEEQLLDEYGLEIPTAEVNVGALARYLRHHVNLPPELAGLPDYIDWVASDTNYTLLDWTTSQYYEGGGSAPDWTIEDFGELRHSWETEIRPMVERIKSVSEWIMKDEDVRMKQLVEIVQTALNEMAQAIADGRSLDLPIETDKDLRDAIRDELRELDLGEDLEDPDDPIFFGDEEIEAEGED